MRLFFFFFLGQIQQEHHIAIVYLRIHSCNQCDASNDIHVEDISVERSEQAKNQHNERTNE